MTQVPESLIGDASAAGFTLLELLVVLTIMGLMLMVAPVVMEAALPRIGSEAAVMTLANDLRALRGTAIMTSREAQLTLDIDTGRYLLNPSGKFRTLPHRLTLGFEGPRDEMLGNAAIIRFFPDGSSTGGTIRMSERGTSHSIKTQWLNGRVSVDE